MGKKSRRNRAKGKGRPQLHEKIPFLIGALRCKHLVSKTDVERVCAILNGLYGFVRCEDLQVARSSMVAIVRAGGIANIISLMIQNLKILPIQHKGSALLSVALSSDTGSDKARREIVEHGGIPTVIASINTLVAQDKKVKNDDEGMVILLLIDSLNVLGYSVCADNVDAVRKAGGVRSAVQILRYLDRLPVRLEKSQNAVCCMVLELLFKILFDGIAKEGSLAPSFLDEIMNCGGIPLILDAMKRFANYADTQLEGSRFMAFVSDPYYGGMPSEVLAAGGDAVMESILLGGHCELNAMLEKRAARTLRQLCGEDVVPQCRSCGRKSEDMMVCNRCDVAWYCSDECLGNDWKNHKAACNAGRWKPLNNRDHANNSDHA